MFPEHFHSLNHTHITLCVKKETLEVFRKLSKDPCFSVEIEVTQSTKLVTDEEVIEVLSTLIASFVEGAGKLQ